MSKKPLLIALLSYPFFFLIATPLSVILSTVYVIVFDVELYGWGLGLPMGLGFAAGFAVLATVVTYQWARESDDEGGISFLNDAKNRFRSDGRPRSGE